MGNKEIILVGLGEVGEPIKRLEEEAGNRVGVVDLTIPVKPTPGAMDIDVMHICIGDSENFVSIVLNYIDDYNPALVIIHSTVKPGTTQLIKQDTDAFVVHSPIRGVHPHLYKGIKTFIKNIGGDEDDSALAHKHMSSLGLKCYWIGNSKHSEYAKILSTTYYGWNILFAGLVDDICAENDLDYGEVYTAWNKQYNAGYEVLGMKHVVRPVLIPPVAKIGGHCVSQNFELLPEGKLKKIVKEINEV